MMQTAIVGAGMAGLAAARALAAHGASVRLFDKGRGPGGRASTRRLEFDGRPLRFDHGFQAVPHAMPHAAARAFSEVGPGAFAPWRPRIGPACALSQRAGSVGTALRDGGLAGIGGANAPIRAMAQGLDVAWGTRVARVLRKGGGFWLDIEGGEACGPFDRVVVAVPADQVGPLVAETSPRLAKAAGGAVMAPCWSAMLILPERPSDGEDMGWDVGEADDILDTLVREASKPGRAADRGAWVAQANADWSSRHLEADAEAVARLLADLAGQRLGLQPIHAIAHRWRFARAARALGVAHLQADGIALCGDWMLGPTLADAWMSGTAAGEALARTAG